MSEQTQLVAKLFNAPGESNSSEQLLLQAASAHKAFLKSAYLASGTLRHNQSPLRGLWNRAHLSLSGHERRDVLCHPLLVSGLHRMADFCPTLQGWHEATACPSLFESSATPKSGGSSHLGAVELALRLRANSQWQGRQQLATDTFGRIEFPFSDWRFQLHSAAGPPGCVLAEERIDIDIDADRATFTCPDVDCLPCLGMSRRCFDSIIADNATELDFRELSCGNRQVGVSVQRAQRIGQTSVRYDPIYFQECRHHAPLTGGIIQALFESIRLNSPGIHGELCSLIHAIRGFELHSTDGHTIQSFSDPVLPGIISVNVTYSRQGDPQLSPLCFTWLGHEMAHTKFYYVNNIAYRAGQAFVLNGPDMTECLPRYGRSLPVRTLFQIPYTHFYEWALLMDFMDADFLGLPWDNTEDPVAAVEDIRSEIDEAFELISKTAQLSRLGQAAVAHFRRMHDGLNQRAGDRGCTCHIAENS